MAVVLDSPVHCGGLVIAALARIVLWPVAGAAGLSVVGHKQPLGVLLHDGSTLQAFDIAGRPLPGAEVEALLPGAGLTLATAWRSRNGPPSG